MCSTSQTMCLPRESRVELKWEYAAIQYERRAEIRHVRRMGGLLKGRTDVVRPGDKKSPHSGISQKSKSRSFAAFRNTPCESGRKDYAAEHSTGASGSGAWTSSQMTRMWSRPTSLRISATCGVTWQTRKAFPALRAAP